MQAIETRYLCPTNHKGARIKAKCNAGSVTISYSELQDECTSRGITNCHSNVHELAARRLRDKLGWNDSKYYGEMVQGELMNGNNVFTFAQGVIWKS